MKEENPSFLHVADFQRLLDRRIAPDGRYMCRIAEVSWFDDEYPQVAFRITVAEGPGKGHSFPYLLGYGEESWRQVRMTCLAMGIGPEESIKLGVKDLEGRELPMIARTVYSRDHLATCFSVSPPADDLHTSDNYRVYCKNAEGSSEGHMPCSLEDANGEESAREEGREARW